jgi:type IV secretory pathway TrbF-like protein
VDQNGFVTLPPDLAQYPDMLAVLMNDQRGVAQAHTTAAERRAQAAERRFYVAAGVVVVALLVIAWLVWHQRDVQALVQVVQVTEEGKLLQAAHTVKALELTPEDGQWAEMLREWLRREFWRGKDVNKEESLDRRWVDLHTCPSSRGHLQPLRTAREQDKKDKKTYGETTVVVDIDTVTDTPTPQSYQINWSKFITSPEYPHGKPFPYTTTFTVGRVKLSRHADVNDNFLGLCVASFSTEPRKSLK